jgi:predicted RNase H-like nuclease
METIADSLEELFEAGGQPAKVLRPFVEVCPPTSRWEQPDGFEPSPSGYAQALREVLAGRRRIRIAGSDGAVLAVRAPSGEWSVEPASP